MNWKHGLTLAGLFLGGWAATAAASQNPSQFQWDWCCMSAALLAAGFTTTLLGTQATLTMQIAATVGSFLLGWGTTAQAIGFRYVLLHFDFRELFAGLAAIGLTHSGNSNVTQPFGVVLVKMGTSMQGGPKS